MPFQGGADPEAGPQTYFGAHGLWVTCVFLALSFGWGREDDHLIRQDPDFADLLSPHDAPFIAQGAQVPAGAFQFGGRLGNAFHGLAVIPRLIQSYSGIGSEISNVIIASSM